ncbi:MAG: acetyl-CoA carboxylase carboxyltransferase subunit beta [Epulopiscium sp.]|nr:acetyl-CoA carboxylase carboxyltransferase subunit beta [Candidatus Epulonipiscium sp.]
MLGGFFKKTKYITMPQKPQIAQPPRASLDMQQDIQPCIPDGMWQKCKKCGQILYANDLKEQYQVCPDCGYHFRLSAPERIQQMIDPNTFESWGEDILFKNPLEDKEYEKKVKKLQENTELKEAILIGKGQIEGYKTVFGVMDSRFLMGSMGTVVGEKLTQAIEEGTKQKLPIILFTASGGARMQEGIFSLMQMAKTSAALAKHQEEGLLSIIVLTDPTTGGVTASFAMLGDIILAEPEALIGFAGPRVIRQTIGQQLPDGFQTAECLLQHGFVDQIVPRKEMKKMITKILALHQEVHV